MTADFLYTSNDKRDFNKEVAIVSANVSIEYKDDTDLINPTFKCRADKWNDSVNYIEVGSPINRMYFVDDVTFSQMYAYIKCSEDVLTSHRSEILKLNGIVERNANLYNMYLTDTKLKCFNLQRVQTFPWLDNSGKPKGFCDSNGDKSACYVLTMSGGGEDEEEIETPGDGGEG